MIRIFMLPFLWMAISNVAAQDCHCLKPEIEVGLGPQWSSGSITEYEIPNSPELSKKPGGPGYSFHLSIRTHPAKWQVGLDLLQDMINLHVYYPVFFPEDYPDHIGDSKWNTYYKAYRFGVGAHVRYNFNTAFAAIGAAYLNPVSDEVNDVINSWSGEVFENENVSYDGNSGVTLSALFGTKFGNGKWQRFSWHAGITYDTGANQFNDETFQRSWSYHNIAYSANINYQLNKTEE